MALQYFLRSCVKWRIDLHKTRDLLTSGGWVPFGTIKNDSFKYGTFYFDKFLDGLFFSLLTVPSAMYCTRLFLGCQAEFLYSHFDCNRG